MDTAEVGYQDVMQVCRNGHVITDLLRSHPEQSLARCHRCGADTFDHCPTCGHPLAGATFVPGLVLLGRREPPQFCLLCGASFPWTRRPPLSSPSVPLRQLESLLRRLPDVARQLRSRQDDQPPFRVEDDHGLEDLVRSLLPVHFDDVCLEGRTPSYSVGSRTDFRLVPESIGLTVKHVSPACREPELTAQWEEDVAYYQRQKNCRTLVGLAYDPGELLVDPARLETALSRPRDEQKLRFIVAS
jgi:Uncharacterized protein conserved in bacteria (DUF2321)/REase_DpnII-MboI